MRSTPLPLLALPLLAAGSLGCLSPGFVPASAAGDGPSLTARADVDDSGARATVHIDGARLGDAFGLSFHLVITPVADGAVALANANATLPFERVLVVPDGARPSANAGGAGADAGGDAGADSGTDSSGDAHADGIDVAIGGSGLSRTAGDVPLADGELAVVDVRGVEAGVFDLRVVDPVLRRADGAFVPCATAGGVLTLEGAR